MDLFLMILGLIAYLVLLSYGAARLGDRILRPMKPLPVYTSPAGNRKLVLFVGLFFGIVPIVASFAVETFAARILLPVLAATWMGCIVTWYVREGRLFAHLSIHGTRVPCLVLSKSTKFMGSYHGDSVFTLSVDVPDQGETHLRVPPSAYHAFHEGDMLELLFDPWNPERWQIIRRELMSDPLEDPDPDPEFEGSAA